MAKPVLKHDTESNGQGKYRAVQVKDMYRTGQQMLLHKLSAGLGKYKTGQVWSRARTLILPKLNTIRQV